MLRKCITISKGFIKKFFRQNGLLQKASLHLFIASGEAHLHQDPWMEVKEELLGVGSLLPTFGF